MKNSNNLKLNFQYIIAAFFLGYGEKGARFALQLTGNQPCPICDYNKKHCRCKLS